MLHRDRTVSRREFLLHSARAGAGLVTVTTLAACSSGQAVSARTSDTGPPGAGMRLGLVTYLWGQDWDVPTLIRNAEETGIQGVELRTEHAHGVEPHLSDEERRAVKARFGDSTVALVGLGTNFDFHHPDPAELRDNVEGAKAYIVLSHDVGGSGVKVKPNTLPEGMPAEKTIAQIGRALNELGRFGADYGQEIRLEVHGKQTQQLPVVRRIMDVADHPNVGVCWNSNPEDLDGQGLTYNFNLVRDRFGATVHVRELDDPAYPYQQLLDLLVETNFDGWILLEARGTPEDRIAALKQQARLFDEMVASAQARLLTRR